ncbi:MAG: enoyl-CoA hydratase/isomerase family protein [Phycisphaerales bacterium]|jgi:3-hydroxyacyl-CoA dehydrogenase/enoyl-CoA hydratase/3-hydroxybutyryl-CoA epimerase|nr:enoyl-CoA hydratase/isomerase family protein [Phycisphaerales bacterium]
MTTSTQLSLLKYEIDENRVITLWLDGGGRPVVVLDRNLIQRLNATLDAIEREENIKGLFLRSDCARVFVAGADLAEIDALDDQGLHGYLAFGTTVFGRLAKLPYPSVAIIEGATLGGGLEIAMHCDAIIASKIGGNEKPYPIGLPEAGLGICPGWGGTQLLPARIDPTTAIEATATGSLFKSNSMPEGLATTTVETPTELVSAAETWLKSNPSVDRRIPCCIENTNKSYAEAVHSARENLSSTQATSAVLLAVETGIEKGWVDAVATEQCELVRLRNTAVARKKLEAFLSKG